MESQKDFHVKRLAELGLLVTTTTPTTTLRSTLSVLPSSTSTTLRTTLPLTVTIENNVKVLQAPESPPEIVIDFVLC